jgi:HEAT repeat protein
MNVTQMISDGDGTTNHITAASQMNHLIHSSSFKPLILLACADCKGLLAPANKDEENYNAAFRLIKHGDKTARKNGLAILRQLLQDDHDTEVHFKAAFSLGMFGDEASKKEGIDFLITTASEKVDLEEIRLGSAKYLIRLTDKAAKEAGIKTLRHLATKSHDNDIRSEAAKALATVGIKVDGSILIAQAEPELPSLLHDEIKMLDLGKQEKMPVQVAPKIHCAICASRKPIPKIKVDDEKILLAQAGPGLPCPINADQIAKAEEVARAQAASEMARNGCDMATKKKGVKILLEIAESGKTETGRMVAAELLIADGRTRFTKKKGFEVLSKLVLTSQNENIRLEASKELISYWGHWARKDGIKNLSDLAGTANNEIVRLKASEILLKEKDSALKKDALKNLSFLAAKGTLDYARCQAAIHLVHKGDDANRKEGFKTLVELTQNAKVKDDVKYDAAKCLVYYGDENAKSIGIKTMIKLATTRIDEGLRLLAAEVLVWRGDKDAKDKAVEALRDIYETTKDPYIKTRAANLCKKLGVSPKYPRAPATGSTGRMRPL